MVRENGNNGENKRVYIIKVICEDIEKEIYVDKVACAI